MKKSLTLSAVLLAISASTALAGGVNINWSDCFGATPTSSVTFNCAANSGSVGTAWVSIVPDQAMTQVVSTTVVVNITAGGGSLPLWWELQPGGCRAGAGVMDYAATFGAVGCPSIFEQTTDTGIPPATNADVIGVGNVVAGVGGVDRVRLVAIGAVQPSLAATIDNTTEYVVSKLAISKAKSTGGVVCAGCNTGAVIVVDEVRIQQPLGVGDQTVVASGGQQSVQYISTASGAIAPPAVVPTRGSTWGAVKALYR